MLLNESEWQNILAKIDGIHSHLTKIIELALAANPKIGLEEIYSHTFSISEKLKEEKILCPVCSRKLSLRIFYFPLIKAVSRVAAECLACGPMEDIPGELLTKALSKQRLPVSIKCGKTLEASRYSLTIRIENFTDKHFRSLLSLTVSNATGESLIFINPGSLSFTLFPHETKELSFNLAIPPDIKPVLIIYDGYYLQMQMLCQVD